jgi:hypothetical protein
MCDDPLVKRWNKRSEHSYDIGRAAHSGHDPYQLYRPLPVFIQVAVSQSFLLQQDAICRGEDQKHDQKHEQARPEVSETEVLQVDAA